ncbi:MAG: PKD domain-containing protein [Bacteroidia bacterium]
MIKKLLIPVLLLIFLVSSSSDAKAQGTAGEDFWVAYMAQDWACYYNQNFWTRDTAELFLSSQFAAKVTITAPGQNYTKSLTLAPNVTTLVSLPRDVVCRYSDSVTMNGVHIESDTTINVYAVNRMWYSKGATVVIPTTSIVESPEYIVTTHHDNYSWGWYCNGKNIQSPEFTIVGIADSSVIEIVPTGASSRNSPANVPFQVTLKKGETFQYMTTDVDLTGSIVRSKYIKSKYAVYAGNRQVFTYRNNGSQTCWSSWDHVYEQMTPTVTWGKEYTALPFAKNIRGYTLKIVAAENNTQIRINNNQEASLNQGEYYVREVFGDSVMRITANNRISVGQITLGGGYYYSGCQNHPDKPYNGDPSMMMLFADEQFGQNATINTVSQTLWWWWNNNWWSQWGPEHYINVMVKSTDTASFKMDNSSINDSLWETAGNLNGYHFAKIPVDSGSHYLNSAKGFLGYVYGYLVYEGYAFAAAANFKPIQNNFVIVDAQCVTDTVGFQAVLNDSFGNYHWVFGDGTIDSGANVRHKYKDTGWYTVKMYCYHNITNAMDSVTKTLYVADTKIKDLFTSDTLVCGKVDMVVISKGFVLDNEYEWNDHHRVYYRAIKNDGLYWLEVMERNGCIFRDTLNVNSSTIPKASFDVSETSFCLSKNKEVTFTNKSTSKAPIEEYIWDFSDTSFSSLDTVIKRTFKRADTYPVILRAVTKAGCYHDTFMFVDVLPGPLVDFEFTRKDTCLNSNGVEFKNTTVSDKNELKRYKWFFSEGYVISNNDPGGPRTYVDTGEFKVNLIYEYNNGCVDTATKIVHIVPNPKADFSFPNATYCSLDTIPFVSTTYSDFRPLSYQWDWGDSTFTSDSLE